jgi:hypothetical protein
MINWHLKLDIMLTTKNTIIIEYIVLNLMFTSIGIYVIVVIAT